MSESSATGCAEPAIAPLSAPLISFPAAMTTGTAKSASHVVVSIGDERLGWFNPCVLTTRTLASAADSADTKAAVLRVLQQLAPDPAHVFLRDFYARGAEAFGEHWKYMDSLSLLSAYARLARPRRYLEIGVRNGKALCVVASAFPSTAIVGFDLFQDEYGGMPLLGPEHIRRELQKVAHTGPLELVTGDSHATVPAFLSAHPGIEFDLVYVDGDHSPAGARADLEVVVGALAYGGTLIFDDLCNPNCPGLTDVWDDFLAQHRELDGLTYRDGGTGVGFALRTAVRDTRSHLR